MFIRRQFVIRYSSYCILLLIVYILRCPPFIKIDKSLTYSVCLFRPFYHSHKKNFYQKIMSKKRRPYWNFWKVVFAGWMIRYPGKMFRIIGVPLGILIVTIYNAVTK